MRAVLRSLSHRRQEERLAGSRSNRKILVLRLSSLGDVILAAAALETDHLKAAQVDWVVAREFARLLQGHPRLHRTWEFDRSAGTSGWLKLADELYAQNYDEVLDLHASLRTRILRLFFLSRSLMDFSFKWFRPAAWRTVSKRRLSLFGLFLFKKQWPRARLPGSMAQRFARVARGTGAERPDLTHLLQQATGPNASVRKRLEELREYVCVMPGSAWPGKRWPVERFFRLLEENRVPAVILGTSKDVESAQLVRMLQDANLPHESGVGCWDLGEVAWVLSRSRAYLGNDTGLAHLAEAVGVSASVVFGPTVPEMGFGPWRKESQAIGAQLWCRPCGKDGRYCFRIKQRYLCLSMLSSEEVGKAMGSRLRGSSPAPGAKSND